MDMILSILSIVVGIGSLICWVMVLIKMFPAEGALKGILAIICGLYAFIWGWMKNREFGLRNVMIAWTVLIVLSIILNGAAQAMYGAPTSIPAY